MSSQSELTNTDSEQWSKIRGIEDYVRHYIPGHVNHTKRFNQHCTFLIRQVKGRLNGNVLLNVLIRGKFVGFSCIHFFSTLLKKHLISWKHLEILCGIFYYSIT